MAKVRLESARVHAVSFKSLGEKNLVGSDIEGAIDFALSIDPASEVLQEAKEHLTNIKEELFRTEMRLFFESRGNDLYAD